MLRVLIEKNDEEATLEVIVLGVVHIKMRLLYCCSRLCMIPCMKEHTSVPAGPTKNNPADRGQPTEGSQHRAADTGQPTQGRAWYPAEKATASIV